MELNGWRREREGKVGREGKGVSDKRNGKRKEEEYRGALYLYLYGYGDMGEVTSG